MICKCVKELTILRSSNCKSESTHTLTLRTHFVIFFTVKSFGTVDNWNMGALMVQNFGQ